MPVIFIATATNRKKPAWVTLNNLGVAELELNRLDAARQDFMEALAIYRGLAERDPSAHNSVLSLTLNNLDNAHEADGELEAAEGDFEEALRLRRALAITQPAAHKPYVVLALDNLGAVFIR